MTGIPEARAHDALDAFASALCLGTKGELESMAALAKTISVDMKLTATDRKIYRDILALLRKQLREY